MGGKQTWPTGVTVDAGPGVYGEDGLRGGGRQEADPVWVDRGAT